MARLDRSLADGEMVIVDTRRSQVFLIAPILMLFVCAVATGAGIALMPRLWKPYGTWVLLGFVILLTVLCVIAPVLRWWSTECLLTNRRIKLRAGFLNTVRHDIPLSHIQQVARTRSLTERVMRLGSLRMVMTSGKVITISGLPRIEWVYSVLSELVWAYGPRHTE